jgi:hypothetical protein
MAIFGRKTLNHWYDPTTGARAPATPLPTGTGWTPVYERDFSSPPWSIDWEAVARPALSVVFVGLLALAVYWTANAFWSRSDSIAWDKRCEEESKLCLTREKAKLSKEFDVKVDDDGKLTPNPRTSPNMTIGPRATIVPPVAVPLPPTAAAPSPSRSSTYVPPSGHPGCQPGFVPSNPPPGRQFWCAPVRGAPTSSGTTVAQRY